MSSSKHLNASDPDQHEYFNKKLSFSELGLERRLFKAVAKLGFVFPTRVQAECIPLALQGRDMLVKARTGSGKTLAYALPALQSALVAKDGSTDQSNESLVPFNSSNNIINSDTTTNGIRVVVLVPTRELCDQVYAQFQQLMYYCADRIRHVAISGDVPRSVQVPRLKELPDIVITTPSRLVEHLKSGVISLKNSLKLLVVDEADLLLSFGYEDDLKALVDYLPKLHQSMLMSATLTPQVKSLQKLVLHNPVRVMLEEANHGSNGKLTQFYIQCMQKDKLLLTFSLLKLKLIRGKTIFFVNSIDSCFRLKLFLEQFSINSAVLNAELPYNSRLNIIQQFNRGVFDYLIATDASLEVDESSRKGKASAEQEEEEEEVADTNRDVLDTNELEQEQDEGEEEHEAISEPEPEPEPEPESEADVHEESKDGKISHKSEETNKKKRQREQKDAEYGVARGIDFQSVSTVVNFDFPETIKNYIHRVGRTARGGASGSALSFVSAAEHEHLEQVIKHQSEVQGLPPDINDPAVVIQPLDFRTQDIEGFRYRVEDVMRAVTRTAVKEARIKELKMELINSEKLKAHFEDNPRELDLLKHDKILRPAKIQPHLKHVPKYLLPAHLATLVVDNKPSYRKRVHPSKLSLAAGKRQKKSNDPLRSFSFSGTHAATASANAAKDKRAKKKLKIKKKRRERRKKQFG